MDLNDKIEIQNKLVEEINKNIDLLISEDADNDVNRASTKAAKAGQAVVDTIKSYAKSSEPSEEKSGNIEIESVHLGGNDVIEFEGDFNGKTIRLGNPKGFKVASYNEGSKGNTLFISGKENRIFKNNGVEDVVLSITLPKSITKTKASESMRVELGQKNLKNGEEEELDDVILRIAKYEQIK